MEDKIKKIGWKDINWLLKIVVIISLFDGILYAIGVVQGFLQAWNGG